MHFISVSDVFCFLLIDTWNIGITTVYGVSAFCALVRCTKVTVFILFSAQLVMFFAGVGETLP